MIGDIRPESESIEDLARAVGDGRAPPVKIFAKQRRGILAIDNGDCEPGTGTGGTEQQPSEAAAGDQELDIVTHSKRMEADRRTVQILITCRGTG